MAMGITWDSVRYECRTEAEIYALLVYLRSLQPAARKYGKHYRLRLPRARPA
jgi:hypothetical protein